MAEVDPQVGASGAAPGGGYGWNVAPGPAANHTESDRPRSLLFPMRQILNQLQLIQDHCAYRRRCYECIAKHMLMIEAWADLGNALAGVTTDDYGKIAQSVSDKLTEVRRLGVVKSRLHNWMMELYEKIRKAYPNLDLEYNQLDESEVDETKLPLLNLRGPYFNLREICKLIQMAETVTSHPELRCVECLRYFLGKAISFANEGSEMTPDLRAEYEGIARALAGKLAEIWQSGILEDTSQWFRGERKRLNETYPELHEQGLYKNYEPPVYLAKCGDTCS
jgi:hypothetical protein